MKPDEPMCDPYAEPVDGGYRPACHSCELTGRPYPSKDAARDTARVCARFCPHYQEEAA